MPTTNKRKSFRKCWRYARRAFLLWLAGFTVLFVNEVLVVLEEERQAAALYNRDRYHDRDPRKAKKEFQKFYASASYLNHTQYVTWLTNNETFASFLSQNENAFVDFFAPWCGHSQRLYPTWFDFAQAVKRNHHPVAIGAVDCSRNTQICEAAEVFGFPSLKWFVNGTATFPRYNWGRNYHSLLLYTREKVQNQSNAIH